MKEFAATKNTVLITGGAGFIGSNFIPFFLKKNPGYRVVNLDKLTYAGNLDHLESIKNNERYPLKRSVSLSGNRSSQSFRK